MNKALLIGLGCSFTQGEGCCHLGNPDVERARAYPKKISDQLGWDSINYAEIGQGSRIQCLRWYSKHFTLRCWGGTSECTK